MVYNKDTTKERNECYELLRNFHLSHREKAHRRNCKGKEIPHIQKAFQNLRAQRFACEVRDELFALCTKRPCRVFIYLG